MTATNPLGQFHLEGHVGDPESVVAVVTLFGEAGGQVRIEFTDPDACQSIWLMLGDCLLDLREAAAGGIEAVIERTGQQHDDEPLTVEHILDAARRPPPEFPELPEL